MTQGSVKKQLPFSPELIAFDFDGVFTDNRVFVDENGLESVMCNRSDGLAIDFLRGRYLLTILSTEKNQVVRKRGQKLKIEVYQGLEDKEASIVQLCRDRRIDLQKTVFIGNDINDLGVMKVCGFNLAPSDAHPRVLKVVDYILSSRGGEGVVREFCESFMGM